MGRSRDEGQSTKGQLTMIGGNSPNGHKANHVPQPNPLEALAIPDDATLPGDELAAAFRPAGPSSDPASPADLESPAQRRSAGAPGQQPMIAAADAYAQRYRDDPQAQRRWAEATPAPVRTFFLAIRENTPGGRVRAATDGPYRYDPAIPQLGELSAPLQHLLAKSWPVWDAAQQAEPSGGGGEPEHP
jgi:hypothetical protein